MDRKLAISALRILSIVLAMFWAGHAFASKRVALVIGNAKYSGIAALSNPINDAPDMAQALRNIGFEVMERTNVSMGDFNNVLADFSRMSQGADTALFFYAGHGVQYEGKSYLLPVDITVQGGDDIDLKGVSQEKVLRAMRGGSVKIVILDACRDNPIAKQTASRGLGGGDSTSRGLARIDITEGMVIAYATSPGTTADDGAGRNSPFTAALVRRIQEPGVEIQAMFQNVRRDVYEKTNRKQLPEVNNSLLDDFYLSPVQGDATAWARISESDRAQDFADFIQRFPNSAHRPNAEYRLRLLNRMANDREVDRRERQQVDAKKDEEERIAKELEANRRLVEETENRLKLARKKNDDERRAAEQAARKQQEEEAIAQQEAERLRIAEEKRAQQEADRKKQEELRLAQSEAARKKAADELAARQEAERQKAAADLVARQEAERRQAEAALKAQQEAERKRLLEEQKTQKAEADRKRQEEQKLALQQDAERKKADAELKAKQDAERKRLEDEQKKQLAEAEKQKAASEALARKAEAERKKQEDETERLRVAEICTREGADLSRFVDARDRTSVEAMRGQAKCPVFSPKVDEAIRKIDTANKLACDADRKALKAAGTDLDAIHKARDAMSCEPARADASQLVARLEEEAATQLKSCADERVRFIGIDRTTLKARQDLEALSGSIGCTALKSEIKSVVVEIETRTKTAQTALKAMACYSGSVNGRFDGPTIQAIQRYLDVRELKFEDLHVTDEFVKELTEQPRGLCKPSEPEAPVASRPAPKEHPVARSRDREVSRPVARAPAPAAPRPAPVVVTRAPAPSSAPKLNIGGVSF